MPALLDEIEGPVLATTTWALAYLSEERRAAFTNVLAAASRGTPASIMASDVTLTSSTTPARPRAIVSTSSRRRMC
jgi:hypothetical protein